MSLLTAPLASISCDARPSKALASALRYPKLQGRDDMQNPSKDKNAPGCSPRRDPHFAIMALSMKASTCFGAKLAAPQKTPVRARTAPLVSASLKEDVAR